MRPVAVCGKTCAASGPQSHVNTAAAAAAGASPVPTFWNTLFHIDPSVSAACVVFHSHKPTLAPRPIPRLGTDSTKPWYRWYQAVVQPVPRRGIYKEHSRLPCRSGFESEYILTGKDALMGGRDFHLVIKGVVFRPPNMAERVPFRADFQTRRRGAACRVFLHNTKTGQAPSLQHIMKSPCSEISVPPHRPWQATSQQPGNHCQRCRLSLLRPFCLRLENLPEIRKKSWLSNFLLWDIVTTFAW